MRKKKIRKEISLDVLPRKNERVIDWSNSIGVPIKGFYDNVDFVVEIKSYNSQTSYLEIEYEGKIYPIHTGNFKNCQFGKIFGKITGEFKIEIGEIFKDEKRDITIVDREYRLDEKGQKWKWYNCKCNKCDYKHWIVEPSILTQKTGCPRCCPNSLVVTEDYNSIVATDPWMVKYFQGGYEEAKEYSRGSHAKVYPICPDCGKIKDKSVPIYTIYRTKSIGCVCGEGISYPEKLITSMLGQLDIEFQTQLTSKNLAWCDKYKYDFYIPSLNMIIETHGEQHYKQTTRKGARTLEQEQENDRLKKELALSNGIEHYVVIDCRKSIMGWIKEKVLKSELSNIFNLLIVDWKKCEKFALSNLVKEVCEYYNENKHMTTSEVGEVFGLTKTTIRKYLIKGNGLGWCHYDTKENKGKAKEKTIETNRKALSKEVAVIKDDEEIMRFSSLRELNDCSLEKLGIKLSSSQVCIRLNPKHKKYGELYKGFTFKYVEDID